MRSPDQLTALFRAHGRKVTPQRQCIFEVLGGDLSHPSAERVHEAARSHMQTISLKTVYQTLHELASLGEIAALDLGTGTARFDPNVEHVHHHLVCRSCGQVRDLHADFSALQVPEGADAGYEVGKAEVVFRGLCGTCREDPPAPDGLRHETTGSQQTEPQLAGPQLTGPATDPAATDPAATDRAATDRAATDGATTGRAALAGP